MKKTIIILLTLSFILFLSFCGQKGNKTKDQKLESINLDTQEGKYSYSLGYNTGNNLRNNRITDFIDLKTFIDGLTDGVMATNPKIKATEIQKNAMELQQKILKLQRDRWIALGERNKKIGEDFLKQNTTKDGIKATKSGLQYSIIKPGNGSKPKLSDTVKIHYRGTLINGTEFDSSIKKGTPAQFVVKDVIKGWIEGIQLMKTGAKFMFFLPSKLAFADKGFQKAGIGPNAVVIYTIELLEIVKTPKK